MDIKVYNHGGVTRVTTSSEYDPNAAANGTYRDSTEMLAAMRDPRYGASPAYREEVAQKISRMGGIQTSNAGAVDGRHQVLTADQQQTREQIAQQQIGQSDHDREMIAKFDRANANGRKGA